MFFLLNISDTEEDDIEVNNYEYITGLYEKYNKTLWKYAFKLSKNNDVANDIVAITFLKVVENIETIKRIHKYKMKSYLMSMIRNNFINHIKKEKTNIYFDDIYEYNFYGTEDDFIGKICVSEVEEALMHMPEPYKSILMYMYGYDEMTYEEIAISLNINIKSIRMYKKRAVDMLRMRMKGGDNNEQK